MACRHAHSSRHAHVAESPIRRLRFFTGKLVCGRIVVGRRCESNVAGVCGCCDVCCCRHRAVGGEGVVAAGSVSASPFSLGGWTTLLTASGLSSDALPSITHLYRTVARLCRESQVSFHCSARLLRSLIPTSPRRQPRPVPSTTRLLHLSSQAV